MRRNRLLVGLTSAATAVALGLSGSAGLANNGPDNARGRGHGSGPGGVQPGISVLVENDYAAVRGEKVGVITNPTGILPDLRHEVDVMAASDDVDLVAVFGPEHGFRGAAQAGESEDFYVDERTGLPIYDTYGKDSEELADIFTEAGVDTVMFDIQDVGARFYTYIWTMYDAMKGAALADKRFVVLDRPNPITGLTATGPVLQEEFSTFVGLQPISQQHGMTVGELARLFNAEFLPDDIGQQVDLDVVEMRGWKRSMTYHDTGLPWVMPSPNMPTVETAFVYPGTGMFEGTNLSEGRGTTRPFELVGAPYVDYRWAEALNELDLPGVSFRETYFTPTFSKHVGTPVGGVQVYVEDPIEFNAIRTGIAMLVTVKRLYPEDFEWRADAWDDEHPYWIDKLTGSTWVRTAINAGKDVDEVVAGWQDGLEEFRALREKHLIYDDRTRGRGRH